MPYGTEVRTGDVFYKIVMENTTTGIRATVNLEPLKADGTEATENQKNTVFQALLNKLAELPQTTIVSATKTGSWSSAVTTS